MNCSQQTNQLEDYNRRVASLIERMERLEASLNTLSLVTLHKRKPLVIDGVPNENLENNQTTKQDDEEDVFEECEDKMITDDVEKLEDGNKTFGDKF